ncbi:MAG: hypothetical protein Q4C58_04270 [Eubacteriales bacterium]|nr:hypothetical protein [Eubacteriales bacterium]
MKKNVENNLFLPGGYSFETPISGPDIQLFQKALMEQPEAGADCTPLACACQVVNGLNYCFLCKRKAGDEPERLALVYVYYHAAHGVAPVVFLNKIVLLEPAAVLYAGDVE